ncbi:MAG TPA: hypothetical protein VGN00_29300 [Puia sp.]
MEVNNGSTSIRAYPGSSQLVSEYKKISNATQADAFFEKFGVGNVMSGIHNPFERQQAYELLLLILSKIDLDQYRKIHKGTPYYFIGWTAYQYFNFGKAIFYMDAAVSEDLKFPDVSSKKSTRPSIEFFLLKSHPGPSGLTAHISLITVVTKTLGEYHSKGGGLIPIDEFRDRFVIDMLYSGAKERSLLTALYTFLLEYEEKEKQIKLRSDTGGSIQPFLDHLFDGAKILESLLEKRGGGGSTLRPKITKTGVLSITPSVLLSSQTLGDAEHEYNARVASRNSFQDCNYAAAFIVRNTTGHSLLWPDQFTSNNSYGILYSCLVNSILWAIEKLWL